MTRVAYAILWIFVFSLPWERFLVLPGMASVSELADAGVSRISVGGAFAFAAYGAAATAARELQDTGTYGFWETAGGGAHAVHEAFKR